MLLQERNYKLYYDDEIEDEGKQRSLSSSVGSSEHSSYTKTLQKPFNCRLRRSTFDLSSVNSLSTSCSDSSSYSLPSPTRKTSTMSFRGQSPSSASSTPEGAASQALMQLAANQDTKSALQEVREEPTLTQEENDVCIRKSSSTEAACTNDSFTPAVHPDCMDSFTQYFLEVILFGCLIVPFLHLTITMERYLRNSFGVLQLAFTSLSAPASSAISQDPINFRGKGIYRSSNSKEDFYGASEAIYSCSSSSSSSDDSSEEEEGSWGHFADFRDELADESSFIPSCSVMPLRTRAVAAVSVPSPGVTTLETLAEGREEDDDAGEDWSF